MTFEKLSPKQRQIFKWCHNDDGYDGIICDGAIRSGKTICMVTSFVLWAMICFDGSTFGICGKTVQSAERNIITPLRSIVDITAYYKVSYNRGAHLLTVEGGGKCNYFYLFGGKDESSYALIQGVTLAGVLLDEVALMPRSFVEQATARCSVGGSKFWFNCNPAGPEHWFYKEWVLKGDERNALHLHFTMGDNPALAPDIRKRYERMYSGVFYRRYILGEWCLAEGLIYEFDKDKHTVSEIPQHGRYHISVDYGTLNPFSAGLYCLADGVATRIDEYYYSGRESQAQMTDEEYYAELVKLAGSYPVECVVVDPSAASFITTIRRHGRFSVRKARNDVLDGIRLVSTLLRLGRLKIHTSCEEAIREFGLYAWDDKASKAEVDKPLKINDHAMDEIRYYCNTILRRELRGMPELRGMKDDDQA